MYSIGISSPSPDVLLDPFESLQLVLQAEIGCSILCNLITVSDI
jgi:hypothetical protein